MLKTFNTTPVFGTLTNTKCAEVFYQNAENFSIVCTFCEMKIFEFHEFLQHFKNVHLNISSTNNDVHIKDEVPDEKEQIVDNEDLAISLEPEVEILAVEDNNGCEDVLAIKPADTERLCATTIATTDSESGSEEEEFNENEDDDYVPTIKMQKKNDCVVAEIVDIYNCIECDKKYTLKRSLQKHVRQSHRDKHITYACTDCDKVYKSMEALRIHRYNHTGERKFSCPVESCDKTFTNPKGLAAHKRLVHFNNQELVCEICGHRTNRKSSLALHKTVHSDEKPFLCKICGKGFRSKTLLSQHHPTHSSDRPHKCDVCSATFALKKALYHHKHLHLDIKKYICKLCGKAYAQAAGLCGHMRQHRADQF